MLQEKKVVSQSKNVGNTLLAKQNISVSQILPAGSQFVTAKVLVLIALFFPKELSFSKWGCIGEYAKWCHCG